jgi:uncharacterized membrane protein YfcA
VEILIGLVIGFAIGVTGVGGGTLTAPALILLLGFSARAGIATALVFSATVKIWASGIYLWRREVDFRVLGYMIAGGLPGAILGASAIQRLRGGRSDGWILAIVGAIVAISAASSLFRIGKSNPGARSRPALLPVFTFPIGLETGFSSAGAGALGSVVLFNLTALSPTTVVGTDLWFGMIISGLGGSIHALAGSCDWAALARLVPAGVVGTILGAFVSRALPAKILRSVALACATGVGILLLCKGIKEIF